MMLLLFIQSATATPGALVLGAAAIGLVANTLAVLAVAWKGGQVIGTMTSTMGQLSGEVRMLRETRDQHSTLIARAIGQLDDLERRVGRLEGP